mgnify:CR=1 FL=1
MSWTRRECQRSWAARSSVKAWQSGDAFLMLEVARRYNEKIPGAAALEEVAREKTHVRAEVVGRDHLRGLGDAGLRRGGRGRGRGG